MSVFVLLFTIVGFTHAEGPPPSYGPEQLDAIGEARIRVSEVRDAVKDGDIAQGPAEARIARILSRLNEDLPTSLTETALVSLDVASVATTIERKKGFFAGIDFLRLGLIGVFTLLTMLLIGKHLIIVLIQLPRVIWEAIAYTGGIAILAGQGTGLMAVNQFWIFFGCLLIGGGLGLTYVIHRHYFENFRHTESSNFARGKYYVFYVCPSVMLTVFSVATFITQSDWMGAFAALSLMTLLGFAGEVIPFGYAIGFRTNDALARATSAGLVVMVIFMCLHAAHITSPQIHAFETGALVVGGFVGYLGLLIASSIRYRTRQKWLIMQVIVLALCFAGVISASILGLRSVQILAGVFLALWTIEKMVELPGRGFVPWVLKLMAASGFLYLIVTYGAPGYARYFIS
jgi:hypothetical protein